MFLTKHFVCPLTFCTTIDGGEEGARELGVSQGMLCVILLPSYFFFQFVHALIFTAEELGKVMLNFYVPYF